MSPRKRVSRLPLVPGPMADLVKFLLGPGRTLTLSLLIVVLFGGAWYWGWQQVRADVTSSQAYVLSPADIVVTDRPGWMSFDIREQVFRDPGLQQGLSIMDPDLNQRIAAAFAAHPWVAEVKRVSKRHPAQVVVDLKYHEPVLMVFSPGRVTPVDVEGNALPPGDIPLNEVMRYPRLECDSLPTPRGLAGDQWGDPRVVGAAEIAAALGDRWATCRLDRIEPVTDPATNRVGDIIYRLQTRSGSIVVWGRSPGTHAPGEPTTAEKLAYLDEEIAKYGTLEGPKGRSRVIDLAFQIRNRRPSKDG